MGVFDRIFCFALYTCCAFILITSMEDLGKIIGFEQMEDLGVAMTFGTVYMHLALMDEKKKDKEEDKDGEKDK